MKKIFHTGLVLTLISPCPAQAQEPDPLMGLQVLAHSTHYRGGQGSESWLVFGKDGKLARLQRRWEAVARSSAPFTPSLGEYTLLPNGHLALDRATDEAWEGTWHLSRTALFLGAVLQSGPLTWHYSDTRQRGGGDRMHWRFDLRFDAAPVVGKTATGEIAVAYHDKPVVTRSFAATSSKDGWQLTDVTDDGSVYNLPLVELFLEEGYGTLSGHFGVSTRRLRQAKIAATAVEALVAVNFPLDTEWKWEEPADVLAGRVFNAKRWGRQGLPGALSQIVFGKDGGLGTVVQDGTDTSGAQYVERAVGTYRITSGQRMSIVAGGRGWSGTWFLKGDNLLTSAVVKTNDTTWIYEHSDGALRPDIWKFRITFDRPVQTGQPASGSMRMRFKGPRDAATVRFESKPLGFMHVLHVAGEEKAEYDLPQLKLFPEKGYGMRLGDASDGATVELEAEQLHTNVRAELASVGFEFHTGEH